jgi:hypothetical protein
VPEREKPDLCGAKERLPDLFKRQPLETFINNPLKIFEICVHHRISPQTILTA